MSLLKVCLGLLAGGLLAAATIEKVAGGDQPPGGPAKVTSIDKPMGVVFDNDGNWDIPEWHRNRITRVDKRGMTSVFAGPGEPGYGGDGGPALKASFALPHKAGADRGLNAGGAKPQYLSCHGCIVSYLSPTLMLSLRLIFQSS